MIILRKVSIVLVFSLLSCNGGDKGESVIVVEEDRPFDKIRFKDLNGQPGKLEKYKGKTIFLNFWATWCNPCIAEMPTIEKAKTILSKENIVFLMASEENAEETESFRKAHNFSFDFLQVQNSEELNIPGLPTTFIFNNEGKLVFSESGFRKWHEKNNIDMILKIINKDE